MKNIAIAIDGPVGAGKSTIARTCAQRLGFIHVDTGAIYRAIGVKYGNPDTLDFTDFNGFVDCELQITFKDGAQQVFVNGVDYTDKIRTPEASMLASAVSAKPEVREFLLELQRDFARKQSVVMDGRDIGTVVLPDADIKIFLTADPVERAKRRYDELIAKAKEELRAAILESDVLADLIKRDHNDANRAHAPLKQAEDAIVADTTGFELDEAIDYVMKLIRERLKDVR